MMMAAVIELAIGSLLAHAARKHVETLVEHAPLGKSESAAPEILLEPLELVQAGAEPHRLGTGQRAGAHTLADLGFDPCLALVDRLPRRRMGGTREGNQRRGTRGESDDHF